MKIKLLSAILALSFITFSCKKTDDTLPKTNNTGIDNINVSDSFNWNTTNEINFSIGTSDSRFQNLIHVIYIYDADPALGGKILAKGSASLIRPFNTKVSFAKATKDVYILKSAPNGIKIGETVSLNSKNINLSFGTTNVTKLSTVYADGISKPKSLSTTDSKTSTALIPSCERSTTNSNIVLEKPEVVCFSSNQNVTIDIQANSGGTVKISAPERTVTVRNLNHTNLNIVVEKNTTVVFAGPELKTNETWTNYGIIEFKNKPDIKGTLDNNGTATFGQLQINSGGTINNFCKLTADAVIADGILNNYSYVLAINSTRINDNGRVNLIGGSSNGAYFETKSLEKGKNKISFFGTNATSLLKITEKIDNNLLLDARQTNNSQIVGGNIELCTEVKNIPSGFFTAPAALGCGAYIEKDDCMPASNGTAPTTGKDSDGDGVVDEDDDYPTDKNKAHNTYSVNYNAGGSTIAFEDNWPTKGDYDLNDVVITYRYKVVTNAENKVVEVNANYKLIATGADYINGAGVQFPLVSGKAKIIKASPGVYLESKQDSVVLIIFDNSRQLQATGNTTIGSVISPKVDIEVSFEVIDGPEIKNFGAVAYNPFIWNNTTGFGRGYETHLYGKNPTNLANTELFGTKDDYSKKNNKFYSTKEKLPWAIEVPIADFGYPVEGKRIDQAYTNFGDWANSGGNSSLEWYKILAGNANPDLIYPVK